MPSARFRSSPDSSRGRRDTPATGSCGRSACRRSAARCATRGARPTLGDVHFVFETEWDSLQAHDDFYQGAQVQLVYGTLQSILTSGPFEVLYDAVVEEPQHDGATV